MILPEFIQQDCWHIKRAKPDLAAGGQYRPGAPERVPFRGAVLPMSTDDLRYAPQGTYTASSRKLYTAYALPLGAEVDTGSGIYTVTGSMDYGGIHSLNRYILERKS